MGGPDGDGEIGIAGIIDAQTHARRKRRSSGQIERSIAGVAGSHDNDHTRADQPFHFHTERALTAREPFGLKIVADTDVYTLDQ